MSNACCCSSFFESPGSSVAYLPSDLDSFTVRVTSRIKTRKMACAGTLVVHCKDLDSFLGLLARR